MQSGRINYGRNGRSSHKAETKPMDRNRVIIVSICLFVSAVVVNGQTTRTLTAADYARAESMLSYKTAPLIDRAGVRPVFLPDGRFWYRVFTPTGSEYVLIDPADGSRKTGGDLASLGITAGNGGGGGGRRRAAGSVVISPDGKLAAFIKDWNLWVRNLDTGKETQLTTDGVENFGYATDNAGWTQSDRPVLLWSPDSKKIATFQQDQRQTGDMYLVSTNVGHPKLEAWKYPLPGDANVTTIQRVVIEVDTPKVIRFKMPPDQHRSTQCDDVSCEGGWDDVYWSPDGRNVAFVSTSRDHKQENLRIADAATGDIRDVMQETTATQFESGQGGTSWRYLPTSNEFIWFSEKDGWGHLYLYDLNGKLKNQITKGDFAVWHIAKIDEQNRVIYFIAGGREKGADPYFGFLYRVNFDGSGMQLLTPEIANHEAAIAPNGNYFIDNYSTPNTPPIAVVRDMTGKKIADLEKADISRLTAAGWKAPIPIKVKARDGVTDLYGLMYTPTRLVATRKYPIVDYIYPGPQGGSVGSRSFSASRNDNQALAELGFVVVQIDGMCNPLRSKKFHDSCYGNMADNTLPDQITGIKQLAAKYPYIDLSRVGIWGHSGGGFATAAAMFRYPDFFKVGISESGNHENRNYEDDWGERYIGLVTKDASGKSNYDDQANQNFAKNLKGKLLLAHGSMDNNVPPSNTLLVVDALIRANKDFDLIIIPNARHGYANNALGEPGAAWYMMRRRWDYFVKNLLGGVPPKEYELKPTVDPRMAGPR
jgi:dipeptidyl aminopeptidase/acylaminoacyl peptidase